MLYEDFKENIEVDSEFVPQIDDECLDPDNFPYCAGGRYIYVNPCPDGACQNQETNCEGFYEQYEALCSESFFNSSQMPPAHND